VRALLLFDFDGTLYRGDAPFRFYAECIARHMVEPDRAGYLARVERHLQGEDGVVAADNWEAVVKLAAIDDPDLLNGAFLETRTFMMSADCPLEVPEGLVEVLEGAKGRVLRAVASNSPEAAAIPLLKKLGLLHHFDAIRHSAAKPVGLTVFADQLIATHGLSPALVMSVGDHYRNDIEPARARGWVTVHISPRGYHPGPAAHQGRRLEDVLPAIQAWVDEVSR
jgi:FMN phosphatase YigB (HAD superfamily)